MKIALVANYLPDRQQSMLRYADMLAGGLREAGHELLVVRPVASLLPANTTPGTASHKWLGHLDKYLLGRGEFRDAWSWADVVHVCDHSNAPYLRRRSDVRQVITCHDLLAIRAALGEDTGCQTSATGHVLQRWIRQRLSRADAIACVSASTRSDVERLLPGYRGTLRVVPNALNRPFQRLTAAELQNRLAPVPALRNVVRYALCVGAEHPRKNRGLLVQMLKHLIAKWNGVLVIAGEPLAPELRAQAEACGVLHRIVEVPMPDDPLLEALYGGASALLFPSRFEGFGWPLLEAQACGCPVIASDRQPLPEVAGEGALYCDPDDALAWASALHSLEATPLLRERLRQTGDANVARHGLATMIAGIEALYRDLRTAG